MEHFSIRTDLALESKERLEAEKNEMRGVIFEEHFDEKRNVTITKVTIETENGAVCRLPSRSYLHVCREVIVARLGRQRVGCGLARTVLGFRQIVCPRLPCRGRHCPMRVAIDMAASVAVIMSFVAMGMDRQRRCRQQADEHHDTQNNA